MMGFATALLITLLLVSELVVECVMDQTVQASSNIIADNVVLNVSFIPQCCDIVLGDDLTSNENLMACVGGVSMMSKHSLSQSKILAKSLNLEKNIRDSEGRVLSPPTVIMTSLVPSNVFELHAASLAINAAYAEHNKYLFSPVNGLSKYNTNRNLIFTLKDEGSHFSQCDYVFWINNDYIITNMTWRIEDLFANTDENIDILIVQDMVEGISASQQNITCILMRNTAWSHQFFYMFDLFLAHNEADVALNIANALTSYLATVPPVDAARVKLISSSSFHASFPSHLNHQVSYPMLQLAGEDSIYARSVFGAGWAQMCGHMKRHNLHPNPAPYLQSSITVHRMGNVEPFRDPLWTYINEKESLSRVLTFDQYNYSLPGQIGLSPEAMQRLHFEYQQKYFEIKNLVESAKQLKVTNKGKAALPFRAINQIYRNTISFMERHHETIVRKSRDDIVFLLLWCYASLRDAFLVPVINIENDRIESDINELKAVVIDIFRILFEVLFKTVNILSEDSTRKSVRLRIVREAEDMLFPRIKMFFQDTNLKEGYYLSFKVLSLQSDIEKKRKAAEYWYYVFESTGHELENDSVSYTYADVDEWIDFFCVLGDKLRDDKGSHQAAVKYYDTGISLIRSMISRRNGTLQTAASVSLQSPVLAATVDKMNSGRLRLASALLGRVLCSNLMKDMYYTLESKQQLEQVKLKDLSESLDIFGSYNMNSFSNSKRIRYETEYELANKTFYLITTNQIESDESAMPNPKKVFKRKKKVKKYDMMKPF